MDQQPGGDPGAAGGARAVLLRPGRGPLGPQAEEAGKQARRRERGMIHPEEPELETQQPGNSLAKADGGARTEPLPARPRGRHADPCVLPRPEPGRWGEAEASYTWRLKKCWAKSAAGLG